MILGTSGGFSTYLCGSCGSFKPHYTPTEKGCNLPNSQKFIVPKIHKINSKSQISTYNVWFTSFVPRVSISSSPPRPMHLPPLHRRRHPDARKACQHCAGGAEATAPPLTQLPQLPQLPQPKNGINIFGINGRPFDPQKISTE